MVRLMGFGRFCLSVSVDFLLNYAGRAGRLAGDRLSDRLSDLIPQRSAGPGQPEAKGRVL